MCGNSPLVIIDVNYSTGEWNSNSDNTELKIFGFLKVKKICKS